MEIKLSYPGLHLKILNHPALSVPFACPEKTTDPMADAFDQRLTVTSDRATTAPLRVTCSALNCPFVYCVLYRNWIDVQLAK